MSSEIEIIIMACLVAVACALPGVFLVLRRVALMSDAISHAILFGIVIAFLFTKSLSSPLLMIGAAVTGLLTVAITELVIHTRKLKKDAAIGLVFPALFSIGVILISRYASNVHIDIDAVLTGEIAFAPFNRFIIHDADFGPKGFWILGGILISNLLFIGAFYKELKLSTFDEQLAASLGFRPVLLHYILMGLVSLTCVGAFEVAGSILVVALIIVPASAAYLLTNRLSHMLFLSSLIGIASALGGYGLALIVDSNIAASMVVICGILFVFIFMFAPEQGLLARAILRRHQKFNLGSHTLLIHLYQSEAADSDITESVVSHMRHHMLWDQVYTREVIAQSIQEGLIDKQQDHLILTDYGRETARELLNK